MRVLQVSSFAPPHLGGLETCAEALFQKIPGDHFDMDWLFSDVPVLPAEPNTIRVKVWNGAEDALGIPVPVPSLSGVRQIWHAVKAADLVHIHDVMYFHSLIATSFARVHRKPILLTLHIWQVPYSNWIVRAVQGLAHATVGRYCLRHASVVVFYNKTLLANLQRFENSRHELVANGIADVFLESTVSPEVHHELRPALQLPRESPVVLFAGRFAPKKGLGVIRSLATAMPEAVFVMCGAGAIDPRSWGLGNVRVVGQLRQRDLRDYFLASDFLLLPSRGEGFPLVIPEAMACGLPCAVYRETWLGLGEAADLFLMLDEHDAEAQLRGFLTAAPDFGWRQKIAAFARRRWDWETTAQRYRELYSSVIMR